jgi:hypothetical protein
MADDVVLNVGSGGDTIAADDVGGSKHQRVKLSLGADGSATDALGGAGAVAAGVQRTTLASDDPAVTALQVIDDWDESDRAKVNPIAGQAGVAAGAGAVDALTQRVTLASDDPAVVALQLLDNAIAGNEMQVDIVSSAAIPVTDNAGSLTVDAPVATPVFVRLSDGSAAITTLPVSLASVPSHAVTNAGTFAVQVSSLPASTNTVEVVGDAAENAAVAGNPVLVGGRYDSSSRTLGNGDVGALALNASGHALVEISAGAGSGGTSAADGATFTRDTTSLTPAGAAVESSAPTLTNGDVAALSQDTSGNLRVRVAAGGISGVVEDAVASGSAEGVLSVVVRNDALSTLTPADGDYAAQRVNARGATWVALDSTAAQNVTVAAALPAGANTIGAVNIAAAQTLATVTTVGTVTNITNQGHLADDAAFTPATTRVMMGGFFADETATDSVDEGDGGAARMTLDRTQIVTDYVHAAAGGSSSYSALSTAAVLTAEIKGSAGKVYSLQLFNNGANEVFVRLYNQTGAPASTDAANIVWRGMVPGDAAGAGFVVQFPKGKQFATGIGIRVSGAVADNDTTVLAANEVMANVDYA